jgi:hypothetical protein
MRPGHSVVTAVVLLGAHVAAAQQPPAAPPPAAPPGAYAPPSAYPPPGYGYPPPPLPPPPPPPGRLKPVGVGYKLGNRLSFLGADVIVAPIEHLALDFQASVISESSVSGYGIAPALQGRLNAGQTHSPYVALGFLWMKAKLGAQSGSAAGGFLNVGYEWRWSSGLGILLGGGISTLANEIRLTDGIVIALQPGGLRPNLEAGLRYTFP